MNWSELNISNTREARVRHTLASWGKSLFPPPHSDVTDHLSAFNPSVHVLRLSWSTRGRYDCSQHGTYSTFNSSLYVELQGLYIKNKWRRHGCAQPRSCILPRTWPATRGAAVLHPPHLISIHHVTSAFKYRGTPPPHHHFCGRAGGAQEDTFHFGFHFRLNLFRVSSVYVVNFDARVRALSFSCSLHFELFASI